MIIIRINIIDSNIWCWKQGLIASFFLSAGGLYWKYENYCNFKFISFVTILAIYVLIITCLKEYNNALISTLQLNLLVSSPAFYLVCYWYLFAKKHLTSKY